MNPERMQVERAKAIILSMFLGFTLYQGIQNGVDGVTANYSATGIETETVPHEIRAYFSDSGKPPAEVQASHDAADRMRDKRDQHFITSAGMAISAGIAFLFYRRQKEFDGEFYR